jgi:hypothetical protein
MKAYRGMEVHLHELRLDMELSGQLHVSVATPRETSTVHFVQKAERLPLTERVTGPTIRGSQRIY